MRLYQSFMEKISTINIAKKFNQFSEQWSPKIIAELNGQHIKIAKVEGEFIWHQHDNEDELFLVIKGTLHMKLRDGERIIKEGEMIVIPKGVEHLPYSEEETWILMMEPTSTLNTGNEINEKTVSNLEKI